MFFTIVSLSTCLAAPGHPSDIVFPEYVFLPPVAEEFRHETQGGIPVYIVEDRTLPLINVVATFRGGSYLEDNASAGLVGMMASLIRDGGTDSLSAEKLDEKFAFLAANCGVRGGRTAVTATLNCLSSNFEESFALFLDMLQHPAFQESRIKLKKDSVIESMKQRNDHPSGILRRENKSVVFGDSYLSRNSTDSSIGAIDATALAQAHERIINPSNLVLSISGDFDKEDMLSFLTRELGGWEFGSNSANPPEVDYKLTPGIYYVNRDVPQGGVRVTTRSYRQGDVDVEAGIVMNYILGGGGFSSRITKKVRSDEGLAYSAGSQLTDGAWSDGVWAAGFESKNETVAFALKLIFDEINTIKTTPVSKEELQLAKNSIIEQFPSAFQSRPETLAVFVSDELTDRDTKYWSEFRDKINSVTAENVMNVAKRLLDPQKMAVVIVGNWEEIKMGDVGERANMDDIQSIVGGQIVELPLRDPLTLEATKK